MGIKYLNKYLMQNCKNKSIEKKHLSYLNNKKIVIDTSIYLYKYQSQSALQENFYLMISLFRKHNIHPLFVFDGKPPIEKMDALKERKEMKDIAKEEYQKLSNSLSEIDMESDDEELRESILLEMEKLKRQFTKISDKNVKSVKEIMDAYGVNYYDAPGEADKICAYLSRKLQCPCMSDDMDMFVFECPFVIRQFQLSNETFMFYKKEEILNELQMSFPLFKQMCVLSGTDYNIHDNNISLNETLKWLREYNKTDNDDDEFAFYNWLFKNTKYIQNLESLIEIHNLFKIDNNDDILDNLSIINKDYDKLQLQNTMKEYGFIFT